MPEQRIDPRTTPYRKTLAELEAEVHVPYEDLVAEQAPPAREVESEWDEEHRQLRLAGGA